MSETSEYEAFERLIGGEGVTAGGELAGMATLARALERTGGAAQSGPRPAFRDALRAKLLDEARDSVAIPLSLPARVRASFAARDLRLRRSFRVVVATAAAVMMLLVSGAAFAVSSQSLPGQALYPMKRAREAMQLAVTFGAVPKANKQLDFARTRLAEIKALADAGETDAALYVTTLRDMDARTAAATGLLIGAFRSHGDAGVLQSLIEFAAAQSRELEAVVQVVPPAARPAARGSIEVLAAVQDRVSSVLGGCPCPADIFVPAASTVNPEKPCTCTSTRSDENGVPTRNQASGPSAGPSDETTPPPSDDHPGSPSPSPGPVDGAVNTVEQLIQDLLPTPVPLPSPSSLLP